MNKIDVINRLDHLESYAARCRCLLKEIDDETFMSKFKHQRHVWAINPDIQHPDTTPLVLNPGKLYVSFANHDDYKKHGFIAYNSDNMPEIKKKYIAKINERWVRFGTSLEIYNAINAGVYDDYTMFLLNNRTINSEPTDDFAYTGVMLIYHHDQFDVLIPSQNFQLYEESLDLTLISKAAPINDIILYDSHNNEIGEKSFPERYKIITLCGSTKFKDEFIREQKRLSLEGNIVLSVGLFGHADSPEAFNPETKAMLDDAHKAKIDMSDEIFVINVGGYIGASTRSEIEYAKKNMKKVNYFEPVNEEE